jgi:hypothetical protein
MAAHDEAADGIVADRVECWRAPAQSIHNEVQTYQQVSSRKRNSVENRAMDKCSITCTCSPSVSRRAWT